MCTERGIPSRAETGLGSTGHAVRNEGSRDEVARGSQSEQRQDERNDPAEQFEDVEKH
jgi:hypothetical protein